MAKGKSSTVAKKEPRFPNKRPDHITKIHKAIGTATDDLSKAWVTLAKSLIELSIEMKGAKAEIWQEYFKVDNFTQYCDEVAKHGRATCYQLMDSYKFIETHRSGLLEDQDTTVLPPWTKCRVVVSQKGLEEDEKEELIEMVFDPKTSRRDIVSRIRELRDISDADRRDKNLKEIKTKLDKMLGDKDKDDFNQHWEEIKKLIEG